MLTTPRATLNNLQISFVSKPLPANVALQSFDVVLGNTTAVLLRLRHMFAAHENPVLSQPVTVRWAVVLAVSPSRRCKPRL